MIQRPFSLSWIKVLACFIRFEKCQIFQIYFIAIGGVKKGDPREKPPEHQ